MISVSCQVFSVPLDFWNFFANRNFPIFIPWIRPPLKTSKGEGAQPEKRKCPLITTM